MATGALVIALSTQASGAATNQPAAATAPEYLLLPTAGFVVYGERCASARNAVVHYRALTWQRQLARKGDLSTRTPVVLGKTCRWARFSADEWQARARASLRSLQRWHRTVGQVVRRLERAMAGTPMSGSGADLERIARRHNVSPYFVVAVAATESSIGIAACSSNRYNAWGLSSCGSGWYVPQFRSWSEAYDFFARYVNRQWPGHSTPWSFRDYADCSDCWARKVSYWMRELFGVPARTVYP